MIFLYRIYLNKCIPESVITNFGETQTKLEPFSFLSESRKRPFIKFNAFITKPDGIPRTIRCAKTSIASYDELRDIVGGRPIIAVLKKWHDLFRV